MTEREKVLLRREGAVRALERLTFWKDDIAHLHACNLFPLPKVTRPREVQAGYWEFRVVNGGVESRVYDSGNNWVQSPITLDQLRALGSLPDHPTEEVEDEDEC